MNSHARITSSKFFRRPVLALIVAVAAPSLSAQDTADSPPPFRFRLIGFNVEAREFFYVDGDKVERVTLRDRIFSERKVLEAPGPAVLYAEQPPIDNPEAPMPDPAMRIDRPSDAQLRMVAILRGEGKANYHSLMLRDESEGDRRLGSILLYNFTNRKLGAKLGDTIESVAPKSSIRWDNPDEGRRALVVLGARNPETGDMRRLRSGYVRLSQSARSLVFVIPQSEKDERTGRRKLRLYQVYDY